MKITTLVIGTSNKAKFTEWSGFLSVHFTIRSLADFASYPEVVESGSTFIQNAVIKAVTYAKALNEYVLSEDGGYEIDALGGAPGIKSRRILPGDNDGTDEEIIDYVLTKLSNVPDKQRGVRLTCAVAVSDPKGNVLFSDTSQSEGIVSKTRGPVLIPGYPYRTLHYLPALGKTYAELTSEEHERFSHKKPLAQKIISAFS